MKKIFTISAILISFLSFAQVPQGISYQAIALNGSGNPVVSSNVGVRLSVLDNTATGTVLYTETHNKMTNAQGLFNLIIGQGTPTTGTFAAINWGVNSKFLKVELDTAGGTSYVLVGTTQLLSVPYALMSKSVRTAAGEGITLTSPNGTAYSVTVNDSGVLSLPSSSASSTIPTSLYMYGTFNSYNASTSLLMGNFGSYNDGSCACTRSPLIGYKYLTAGSEIKFLSQNNSSSPIYSVNGSNNIVLANTTYTVSSNGFYFIEIDRITPNNIMNFDINSISPTIRLNSGTSFNSTYNVGTNTLTFNLTGIINTNNFTFSFPYPSSLANYTWGDNLADSTIEVNGATINFPGSTSTPKNYRVDLVLNFNGSGNYTITQVP